MRGADLVGRDAPQTNESPFSKKESERDGLDPKGHATQILHGLSSLSRAPVDDFTISSSPRIASNSMLRN